MPDLVEDLKAIQAVFKDSPTGTIRELEWDLPQLRPGPSGVSTYLKSRAVSEDLFVAAINVKQLVGQLNVVIHALGVLITLPHILEQNERVDSVTLGAGNAGRDFDLLTDLRVAEFKFIQWRGGAEAIRQNSVFKDYLKLPWDARDTRKQLFLLGTAEALAFLRGRRALSSVLSRNVELKGRFESLYGTQFQTVGEFYRAHENRVEIQNLRKLVPAFATALHTDTSEPELE